MKVYKKAFLPAGFVAGGMASGIKRSGKLDLALFYSLQPSVVSVKSTKNKMAAAPVRLNRERVKKNSRFQAIVVNSGNANCFTGEPGMGDARNMARYAGFGLGVKADSVLVASTGIINKRLPVSKVKAAMPALVKGLSARGIDKASKAILTTDTFAKEVSVKFELGSRPVTICGIAKGSGMCAPNMATMLAFIFTDAAIETKAMDKSLGFAVDRSFNCVSVDNCMSTNDTVILMANGRAGNRVVKAGKDLDVFRLALNIVCIELAKMIAKDGEGATKFIRVRVDKAKDFDQARKIALSVANSDLVKTALYGQSPNYFGRVVAAVGATGIDIKEKDLKIKASSLKKKEIDIDITVNTGKEHAMVFTCDMTHGYIKINTEYN